MSRSYGSSPCRTLLERSISSGLQGGSRHGSVCPGRCFLEVAEKRLERDFDRAKRILVPNLSDWTQAGRVLARLAAKYHYEKIGQGRLTNDALIAMSAGRLGIRVITANERDFSRLAESRAFQWQVTAL